MTGPRLRRRFGPTMVKRGSRPALLAGLGARRGPHVGMRPAADSDGICDQPPGSDGGWRPTRTALSLETAQPLGRSTIPPAAAAARCR